LFGRPFSAALDAVRANVIPATRLRIVLIINL